MALLGREQDKYPVRENLKEIKVVSDGRGTKAHSFGVLS